MEPERRDGQQQAAGAAFAEDLVTGSDHESDEERPLIGFQSEEDVEMPRTSRHSRVKNGIKQKGRKLKRRLDNSKAPMTILWGRDGWEKFLALCIFSLSLGFQCMGLFGSGWLKHCYSIAWERDKLQQCPSYHLWDMCRAKGSNGCLGYNIAIFLLGCSVFATIAIIHALWAYLKGQIRTFQCGPVPSNVVSLMPGLLTLAALASVALQPPPYRATLWWNFYVQLSVSITLLCSLCCTRTKGMG